MEYRLATYLGAKVVQSDHNALIIVRGTDRLEIFPESETIPRTQLVLNAPELGTMSRYIHESLACAVRYRFFGNGQLMFDMTSDSAGFEYVEKAGGEDL